MKTNVLLPHYLTQHKSLKQFWSRGEKPLYSTRKEMTKINDYCNVFMAYFINDKHCFNELAINTFKLQDFFHIW